MKGSAKRIFWNALLLTAATLLMRTVSVTFGVYISNLAGAEAMGLFSLMSGVYGFALTLATSGIHLGVTHTVVEAMEREGGARVWLVMRRAVAYALFFGTLASILLIGFARPIGLYWLKDARTITSLRLFGITLPLIALSSALGGYFTAVRRTYKSAAVQVAEQGVKIGATMYLLALLVGGGIERTLSALVLGGAIAELSSFLINLLLYLTDRHRHLPNRGRVAPRDEGRRLLRIALPIALAAYVRSGLITLEHVLIPEGLRNSGSSHAAALSAYGCIQGMALPIILYPAALISAFSGLLVPELAECQVKGSRCRIRYMIARVWWLALLFSIGVSGILVCFSTELGEALYPGTEAGYYIRLFAPLVPIMYVDTATDAMMKGLGEQVYSMNVNILDALISVVLVWLLVPRMGIVGYLITVYFSETFNTVVSITHLLSISQTRVRLIKWVYMPLLSVVLATSIARAVFLALPPVSATGWSLVLHCGVTLALYLAFLLLTGCLDRDDRAWLASLFEPNKS